MGKHQTYIVSLTQDERDYLVKSTRGGDWSPREIKRAQILLRADINNGKQSDYKIAQELYCYPSTVTKLRERFAEERLGVIHDKARSGRPKIIDGDVEAHVIAITCSKPPEGRERWTMQLIADRLVQLTDLESCSEFTVRQILKKTNLNLGKKKNGKYRPKQMRNLSGEWKKF